MIKAMFGGHVCIILYLLISLPISWGLVAFYHIYPELTARIEHTDQVLPHFVVTQLPVLFRSLIMAGVLAALMSSFDSAINGMSNITVTDFYRRYFARRRPERHYVLAAKTLTVFFGAVVLVFAVLQYDKTGDTAIEKFGKLRNLIASPVVSFFLLGIFSKRTNTGGLLWGALFGILFSVVFNGRPGMVPRLLDWFNWMWVGGLATIVNLVVGYLASFLFSAAPVPSVN